MNRISLSLTWCIIAGFFLGGHLYAGRGKKHREKQSANRFEISDENPNFQHDPYTAISTLKKAAKAAKRRRTKARRLRVKCPENAPSLNECSQKNNASVWPHNFEPIHEDELDQVSQNHSPEQSPDDQGDEVVFEERQHKRQESSDSNCSETFNLSPRAAQQVDEIKQRFPLDGED